MPRPSARFWSRGIKPSAASPMDWCWRTGPRWCNRDEPDGFAIATEDLRLRGPGEFVGARQSGVPLLRYADLEADAELIEVARGAAEVLLRDDPALATALMERWQGGREGLLRA